MSMQPKSSLVLGKNNSKKEKEKVSFGKKAEVDYKQTAQIIERECELSDEQKEAEFNRQHEEYIQMKANRKIELLQKKREQFGTSSSDDNSSSDQDKLQVPLSKSEVKKSKGNINLYPDSKTYPVLAQVKKTAMQTQLKITNQRLLLDQKPYQINQLTRISLLNNDRKTITLKVAEDEISLIGLSGRQTIVNIISNIFKAKVVAKDIKVSQLSASFKQQQILQQNIMADQILKKSQFLGSWDQRFVAIRKDGVYSYKNPKAKHTMHIPTVEIKELQTFFELHKGSLIVKLIYSNTKTEFGIPLQSCLRWMNAFARMIAFFQ